MTRSLLILALAALLPACSHGQTSALQSLARKVTDTFHSEDIPTVNVTSSNTTSLPQQSQSLPPGYSTNSGSVPANYNSGAWSSNLANLSQPAATNAPVVSGRGTPPVTLAPNNNNLSIQSSTPNTPSLFSNPNGTTITPTTNTPGLTITPTNATITPANK